MKKIMCNNHLAYHRQQGAALAVSLILMVALTILGVATLTSTRFQEQITSNAQQKSVAFEAAESAIAAVNRDIALILGAIKNRPVGQTNDPDPVFPAGYSADLSNTLSQQNSLGVNVKIDSDVSVQYCGEQALQVGSELSGDLSKNRIVWLLVDINGLAEIENSNASADHIERIGITAPETQSTGDCTLRGV